MELTPFLNHVMTGAGRPEALHLNSALSPSDVSKSSGLSTQPGLAVNGTQETSKSLKKNNKQLQCFRLTFNEDVEGFLLGEPRVPRVASGAGVLSLVVDRGHVDANLVFELAVRHAGWHRLAASTRPRDRGSRAKNGAWYHPDKVLYMYD